MKLLYLCTHNACRSILSEAVTRRLAAGRIDVASAGTSPAAKVHPLTLQFLHQHGYNTTGLHSKSIEAVRPFDPDVVITVCDSAARESCPVWLGQALKAHWGLTDPSHFTSSVTDIDDAFAKVMAKIEQRIGRLLELPFESMTGGQLTLLLNDIGEQG